MAVTPALLDAEAQPDLGLDLDAHAADLAVALGEVDVARGEERPLDVDRQVERRAGDEPPDVEVAARLPWRDRPQAGGGERRVGLVGRIGGDRQPRRADRLLPCALLRHQRPGGGDAEDARVHHRGHRDARERVRAGGAVCDLPLHEVRIREEVREEAEPGHDPVDAEVRGLVAEDLDGEEVAGLRALDRDRPGQGMSCAEAEPPAVGVGARARQLPIDPVAGDERHRLAGRDARHRLEVGMPAVVAVLGPDPHRSSCTRPAVAVASATSSSVHVRGAPSWCSETIARTAPSTTTGVTICAAIPP